MCFLLIFVLQTYITCFDLIGDPQKYKLVLHYSSGSATACSVEPICTPEGYQYGQKHVLYAYMCSKENKKRRELQIDGENMPNTRSTQRSRPLQCSVLLKNGVFWDVMPCGPCHPDEGGAKFLRNVGSYKSHSA
jgi:hypothetical protein